MDPTSGGAGSSDPNSGEGPLSATAPADQSSSRCRYESQKRPAWNTFRQYLENNKPPPSLAMCSGQQITIVDATITKGFGLRMSFVDATWDHEKEKEGYCEFVRRFAEGRITIADATAGCVWDIALTVPLRAPHLFDPLAKAHGVSLRALPLPVLATILSNQGESSDSGGRAGEERNDGGGDGNQGIGGGVGGGGQREGIGDEQRGSRGSSHGGGNGDDDDNDRRRRVRSIEDERRPMDPRPDRMAEILLPFNVQIFATVESLDITGLSVRVRIVRVVSLGFTSVALVCLSASIRQRGTDPRFASILSWIGSIATFLGFISMIAMALLASFIP